MVWNLIDLCVLGRTANDSREDFRNVFSFHEAFVQPCLPGQGDRGDCRAKPGAGVRS
jgi:uncharacterized repeat protein (TIGR04138 family)